MGVQKRAQELAAELEGTCRGTPDEVFEVEGLAEALDEIVFECTQCGWWSEIADLVENENGGDDCCRDCHDE